MDIDFDKAAVKKCLCIIENKLKWGTSNDWTSYDFEKLSSEILMHTGVKLSVTTLKRVWGKLKYTSVPTITTLNTLAKFSGYADWRAFSYQLEHPAISESLVKEKPRTSRIINFGKIRYFAMALFCLAIICSLSFWVKQERNHRLDYSSYYFSNNKIIDQGIPNSVIFNYDARSAGSDSVFIAQSWDVSRKVAVLPVKGRHSSIYYHPGYFKAKLMVGGQVVREHDLLIASKGWLALVDREKGVPLYFTSKEILKDNSVTVDQALFASYNIPLQPALPKLSLFNVKDLGALKNDKFVFETKLKSSYHFGNAACQHVEVLILCKNDVISIPLCSKGCVGELFLYVPGKEVSSKDSDLSKFGCDLDQWVSLRVESKNRYLRILINNQEAYSVPFSARPAEIVGVQYRFNGTGSVKDTRFLKDKQVINL